MIASRARGVQRRESRSAASITCLISRSWSSVSRIVKLALRPTSSAWRRKQPRAERMEGAEPEALDALPEQVRDPADHLARGLVGEGDREHLPGPRPAGQQQMREPRGQHPRLAGAGAGQHQQRPVGGLDRGALLRIEPAEPNRRRGRRRAHHHLRLIAHETP